MDALIAKAEEKVQRRIDELEGQLKKHNMDFNKVDWNGNVLNVYIKAYLEQQHGVVEVQNEDQRITLIEMINQFLTFYFAGTDSTAAFATMAIYMLAKRPEFREKIAQELERNNVTWDKIDYQ